MNTDVRKLLLETRLRSGGGEYVFPESLKVTKTAVSHRFKALCQQLGIKDARFHDLRHTAATRMVESNIGIDKVSKILGHASIQMTMRYSHPDNSLREAVETLANFRKVATKKATSGDLEGANYLS